jgi:hypothetical protein
MLGSRGLGNAKAAGQGSDAKALRQEQLDHGQPSFMGQPLQLPEQIVRGHNESPFPACLKQNIFFGSI